MRKAIRHGDVLLVQEDSIPTGLKKSESLIFLAGKNNNHSISQGEVYIEKNPNALRENEFKYGYILAKNSILIHNEHSPLNDINRNAKIPDGVYSIWKQKEETPQGFRIVLD